MDLDKLVKALSLRKTRRDDDAKVALFEKAGGSANPLLSHLIATSPQSRRVYGLEGPEFEETIRQMGQEGYRHTNDRGTTALHLAAFHQHPLELSLAEILIGICSGDAADNEGHDALYWLAAGRHPYYKGVAALLIASGCRTDLGPEAFTPDPFHAKARHEEILLAVSAGNP